MRVSPKQGEFPLLGVTKTSLPLVTGTNRKGESSGNTDSNKILLEIQALPYSVLNFKKINTTFSFYIHFKPNSSSYGKGGEVTRVLEKVSALFVFTSKYKKVLKLFEDPLYNLSPILNAACKFQLFSFTIRFW